MIGEEVFSSSDRRRDDEERRRTSAESGQINTIDYHKRKMNREWKSNESTMSADV